ncbi:hypothetical protein EJB05_27084, partial [Eragrostis curvula]
MSATGIPVTVFEETWCAQRADGTAAVLAIGTANPANYVPQDEFADWYFRVTKSQHLTELQAKTKRICEKSGIEKRHFHHIEETIADHPEITDRAVPSLGSRLRLAADAVPELAAAAARKAIAEWGRPATDITHLVLSTSSSAGSPGADLRLAALLGLDPSVQRTTLYLHGCSAGAAALRVAKDVAENNRGARVLVACADVFLAAFRAPEDKAADLGPLVARKLWGDGAGAVIVGAVVDDDTAAETSPRAAGVESPIFHMVSASQATVPGTERAVGVEHGESGLDVNMSAELPRVVRTGAARPRRRRRRRLERPLLGGAPRRPRDPGRYEAALGLKPGTLASSRHVLREHGNMLGATIFFVLDDIRRRGGGGDEEEGGDDCEWGVLLGLGPGVAIEIMVLRAAASRD